MLEGARVVVVVPAKNEADHIGQVLETMPSWVDGVIVVDDGSRDRTAELARAGGAQVIVHSESRGVGAAIFSGYRAAVDDGADVVAVMAGDGQMCPADLEPVVRPVVRGEADYTKGDRFGHPDVRRTMPVLRYRVGQVLSRMTALATGLRGLSDSQSGYTAIGRRAISAIDWDQVWPGYGYPNDLLGHLARARLRVVDVPIRPVYRGERSGLRPRHVAKIVRIIGRAAWLRARA